MTLANKKILVTGGTGFLGSHVVERLLQQGALVHAQGRQAEVGEKLKLKGVVFWQGDLADFDFVQSLPQDFDAVIHTAALSSPWGRYQDFYRSNVLASRYLAQHFQGTSVERFVHISSPSLYADTHPRFDVRENDRLPRSPLNHYILTKRLAEDEMDLAFTQGLPVVTLRPQGIVGPGDRAIFPRILRTAKKGFIPRIGHGQTWIDLTYVDNVVDAITLAIQSQQQSVGRKYNITNGEPVDLYELIAQLLQQLDISFRWKHLPFGLAYSIARTMEAACRFLFRNTEPLLTRYSVCVLGVSRTLNIEAARRDLGYEPRVSLQQALHIIARDLKAKGVV